MSLPPAEQLSRWTVSHVNNWLTKSSLTAFRDDFLRDAVDGNKLMRMQPREVDAKYGSIPDKKRQILKEHLSRIESPKSPPATWNVAAPEIPPRRGERPQAPLPPQQDDGDAGDDGWGSEDFEDDIDEEYLEPTHTPAHIKQVAAAQGQKLNGHPRPLPSKPEEEQPVYEISADELDAISAQHLEVSGLKRKPSLVDRLKNELQIRKRDSQAKLQTYMESESEEGIYIEPLSYLGFVPDKRPPPPPPPLGSREELPSYSNLMPEPPPPGLPPRPRPPPSEPAPVEEEPDVEYEIVSDSPRASAKKTVEKNEPKPAVERHSREVPLPPRPGQKSTEKPPPPEFSSNQAKPPADKDDLSSYQWYHGKISRDHAQTIFHREQKDGMFLIRKSERDPQQPYTLVIWHCNRIWNIPIRKVGSNKFAAGKFKEAETHFESLPTLVEHFKVVSLNLKSDDQVQGTHNLTVPAPKK